MDYFKPFSADTQAAFFSAEAEMIRFGERTAQLPHAEYLKTRCLRLMPCSQSAWPMTSRFLPCR